MENGGQLLASLEYEDDDDDDVEFEDEFEDADAPIAMLDGMLGLLVVIKLPQICLNASARSGPTLDGAGPKSVYKKSQYDMATLSLGTGRIGIPIPIHIHALTSAPCNAGSTENWYLYEVLP